MKRSTNEESHIPKMEEEEEEEGGKTVIVVTQSGSGLL